MVIKPPVVMSGQGVEGLRSASTTARRGPGVPGAEEGRLSGSGLSGVLGLGFRVYGFRV